MQFILLGYDGTDNEALSRRMAARDAHIAKVNEGVAKGCQIIGVAMLDDAGKMCGSVMVYDFPDKAALDEWIADEPYITGKVWERIEIMQGAIPPAFSHLLPKAA